MNHVQSLMTKEMLQHPQAPELIRQRPGEYTHENYVYRNAVNQVCWIRKYEGVYWVYVWKGWWELECSVKDYLAIGIFLAGKPMTYTNAAKYHTAHNTYHRYKLKI